MYYRCVVSVVGFHISNLWWCFSFMLLNSVVCRIVTPTWFEFLMFASLLLCKADEDDNKLSQQGLKKLLCEGEGPLSKTQNT